MFYDQKNTAKYSSKYFSDKKNDANKYLKFQNWDYSKKKNSKLYE